MLTASLQRRLPGIFVGIESLSTASLREANKSFNNVQRYRTGSNVCI
jgi:hypothetical protein